MRKQEKQQEQEKKQQHSFQASQVKLISITDRNTIE